VTRMLVGVRDTEEAAIAAAAGVDGVEWEVPAGLPPDLAVARAIRMQFPGALRLRFPDLSITPAIVTAAADTRADEIALSLDVMPPMPVVDTELPPNLTAVAVVTATVDMLEAIQRVRDRVGAIMLDAGTGARLIDKGGIADLDAFASACRAASLPFGLAGSLEAPDVARLLLLRPDVLAFDIAVRRNHDPAGPLDPAALDAIRALIPREDATAAHPARARPTVTDRIFVRDFVVLLSIGAYQAEHGAKQRVRFSIDADIRREARLPHDMRDVFSYDVMIETIRVLSRRSHVTFVETLAEEIAAALLGHRELVSVTVKVEKLDVIDGAVGLEITRRPTDRS
jgi:FolB domain-containing protein